MNLIEDIQKLKKEKNVVILAHYYVDGQIQDIADYVGDSFFLAKKAVETNCDAILFCGVEFMGESAKILNPKKTVLLPDMSADCPMAHMATIKKIKEMKAKYDDLMVVCYINSTAKLKEYSDVCVTSSNALKIVQSLESQNIFFIPDQNLGRYVASQVSDKNIILNDGYCPIHHQITVEEIQEAKRLHPEAKVLIHPECQKDVVDLADYVGSTLGIINYAKNDDHQEYIIVTEEGVLHQLQKDNPNKSFYLVNDQQICKDMKKITLDNVYTTLRDFDNVLEMDEDKRLRALKPLEKMLELG